MVVSCTLTYSILGETGTSEDLEDSEGLENSKVFETVGVTETICGAFGPVVGIIHRRQLYRRTCAHTDDEQ